MLNEHLGAHQVFFRKWVGLLPGRLPFGYLRFDCCLKKKIQLLPQHSDVHFVVEGKLQPPFCDWLCLLQQFVAAVWWLCPLCCIRIPKVPVGPCHQHFLPEVQHLYCFLALFNLFSSVYYLFRDWVIRTVYCSWPYCVIKYLYPTLLPPTVLQLKPKPLVDHDSTASSSKGIDCELLTSLTRNGSLYMQEETKNKTKPWDGMLLERSLFSVVKGYYIDFVWGSICVICGDNTTEPTQVWYISRNDSETYRLINIQVKTRFPC